MIDPIDEDEREQLLRELLVERFGPIPQRPAEKARTTPKRTDERRRAA